jgi:aryl-alcohol dehydrogenase-like predicted oxidoreductase
MRYVSIAGRDVSVIGLGTWQFGSTGWGYGTEFGQAEAKAIVKRALALGVNLFDTAEVYARGRSEAILGEALGARRDEAFVATKLWPHHALRRQVLPALRRSLARLGTDRAELYQLHWPNPVVPLSWTMAGMRDARDAGLAREIGVSNFGVGRWRRADAELGAPVVANQVPYNLLERRVERELLPFAQAEGRTIIAYSPLAQGLLSGRYNADNMPGGFRRANRHFTHEGIRRAEGVLDLLRQVADAHAATMAQAALAWCVHHPNVVAIPGAKGVWQMEENAAAADVALTDGEMAALDEASAAFKPVGRLSLSRFLPIWRARRR